MKRLLSALIQSIPDFSNVVVFLLFVFTVIAILGVHQYSGSLYNRCRYSPDPESPDLWLQVPNITRVCSANGLGVYECPRAYKCGNPRQLSNLNYENITSDSAINYGITNFNNVGTALLAVFQIVATAHWTQLLLDLMDADIPLIGTLYCFLTIILCSFFLMNFILAVIIQTFTKIRKRELEQEFNQLNKTKEIVIEYLDDNPQKKRPAIIQKLDSNKDKYITVEDQKEKAKFDQKILKNSPSNLKLISPWQLSKSKQVKEFLDLDSLVEKSYSLQKGIDNSQLLDESKLINPCQDNYKIKTNNLSPLFYQSQQKDLFKQSSISISISQDLDVNGALLKKQVKSKSDITYLNKQSHFFLNSKLLQKPQKIAKLGFYRKKTDFQDNTPKDYFDINQDVSEEEEKIFLHVKKIKMSQCFSNMENHSQQEVKFKDFPSIVMNQSLVSEREQYFNQLFLSVKQELQHNRRMSKSGGIRKLVEFKLSMKQPRLSSQSDATDLNLQNAQIRASQNRLFSLIFRFINSDWFLRFINVLIIFNTIVLALYRYPIQQKELRVLDYINNTLTFAFVAEMILKLGGLGLLNYVKDYFNIFDSIVVLTTVVDFIISVKFNSKGFSSATALRTFRLLRIFKLARTWTKVKNLLKTMLQTLKDVSTFSILLLVFLSIYTLLGMELFAYQLKFNDTREYDLIQGVSPRKNFDSFINSFVTIFIILTNDGWVQVFYDCYRSTSPAAAVVFFVTFVIIGQRIMLNLFLAILLENFDEYSLNEEVNMKLLGDSKEKKSLWRKIKDCICQFRRGKQAENKGMTSRQVVPENSNNSLENFQMQEQGGKPTDSARNLVQQQNQNQQELLKKRTSFFSSIKGTDLEGKSLNIFSTDNCVRKFFHGIITTKYFDIFIILMITFSSIELALYNPNKNPNGHYISNLNTIDIVTTVVFSVECLMKIWTFGLIINGKSSYLQNGWNIIDFIIVIFSIISFTPLSDQLNTIKILRVVRILRLLNQNEGLQVGVKALVRATPQIISVTVVMLLFFLIFAVIGVSGLKGKFYYCDSDEVKYSVSMVIGTKWDCVNSGAEWLNRRYSFDNTLEAMRTLFQIACTSGWPDIMYSALDASSIDYAPIRDSNKQWILFFIVFIIVGSFFLLNLFVGVIISTYHREKDKLAGNSLLPQPQRRWIHTQLQTMKINPIKKVMPPTHGFRKLCYQFCMLKYFDTFILGVIISNMLLLALKHYREGEHFKQITNYIGYLFTVIFTVENASKIIALKSAFFDDRWNTFGFFMLSTAILSIIVSTVSSVQVIGVAVTVMRSFLILRLFRLIRRAKSLRLVFSAFTQTMPVLMNVGGLFLLIIYLYSVVGVILFGQVKRNGVMADMLNFESFYPAFTTMFVVASGDRWDLIVDAMQQPNSITFQCVQNPTYQDYVQNGNNTVGCGNLANAVIFFYSYIFLVNLIFLNLFIAIILQGYDDTLDKENSLLTDDVLDDFKAQWSNLDPSASGFIPKEQLTNLMLALQQPLGWEETVLENKNYQEKFIQNMDLPLYNDEEHYAFLDVLEVLSMRLFVKDQLKMKSDKHNKIKEMPSLPPVYEDCTLLSTFEKKKRNKQETMKIKREIQILDEHDFSQTMNGDRQAIQQKQRRGSQLSKIQEKRKEIQTQCEEQMMQKIELGLRQKREQQVSEENSKDKRSRSKNIRVLIEEMKDDKSTIQKFKTQLNHQQHEINKSFSFLRNLQRHQTINVGMDQQNYSSSSEEALSPVSQQTEKNQTLFQNNRTKTDTLLPVYINVQPNISIFWQIRPINLDPFLPSAIVQDAQFSSRDDVSGVIRIGFQRKNEQIQIDIVSQQLQAPEEQSPVYQSFASVREEPQSIAVVEQEERQSISSVITTDGNQNNQE